MVVKGKEEDEEEEDEEEEREERERGEREREERENNEIPFDLHTLHLNRVFEVCYTSSYGRSQ